MPHIHIHLHDQGMERYKSAPQGNVTEVVNGYNIIASSSGGTFSVKTKRGILMSQHQSLEEARRAANKYKPAQP